MTELRITCSAAELLGGSIPGEGAGTPAVVFTPADLLPGGEMESGPGRAFPVMLAPGARTHRPSLPCLVLEPASPLLRGILDGGISPESLSGAPGLLRSAAVGIMLPFILHNLNNRLVGVVGNLDLAGIFAGQPEKCSARVEDARTSMDEVRTYLDELGRIVESASPSPPPNLASALDAAARLASAGKGRTVSLDADRPDLYTGIRFPSELVPACCGLACAALLSLSGAGSLSIGAGRETLPAGFALRWSRSGTPHPGPWTASAIQLLAASAGIAVAGGAFIRIGPWGDAMGEAEVALPLTGVQG
jgi:hypothetical protein